MQVDNEFQFLRDNNTGTLIDGHTFGKVFESFVLGGDDTCCIALEGHASVVGYKENIKVLLITPFFECCYLLTHNFLPVINPIVSFL